MSTYEAVSHDTVFVMLGIHDIFYSTFLRE